MTKSFGKTVDSIQMVKFFVSCFLLSNMEGISIVPLFLREENDHGGFWAKFIFRTLLPGPVLKILVYFQDQS